MQRIVISVDASCHMDEINLIVGILRNEVAPLLKYHFKVLDVNIEHDVFARIYIDVEGVDGVKMNYLDIVNYCHDLCQTILWNHNIDTIVSVYTKYK